MISEYEPHIGDQVTSTGIETGKTDEIYYQIS